MVPNWLKRFFRKSSNPYPKSFGKRLTWRIMLVLFVVMGIPAVIVSYAGYEVTYFFFGEILDDLTDSRGLSVRRLTSDIQVATVNTVPQLEENLDNPDQMLKLMERMVQLNPEISSCGISFKENYYPKKGRAFCPYAARRDSTVVVETLGGDDYPYLHAKWFTEALQADSGYWSKPFFSNDKDKTPTVAYMVPIRDKNRQTVAVLGVDVSLNGLSQDLLRDSLSITTIHEKDSAEWKSHYDVYTFLIDQQGNYLMHPDSKRIVKGNILTKAKESNDSTYQHLARQMVAGETEDWEDLYMETMMIDGCESVVFYKTIDQCHWTIAIVMPSLIFKIVGYIFGGFLFFLIFIALIVVSFVGYHLIRQGVMPVRMLAWSAKEVAKGNFKAPLPILKSRDEIHQLRDTFEQMQLSLAQYTEELTRTTTEKATIESELNVAHTIQMSMLPKTFPPYPQRNDIDIFGQVQPAKAVGGDLFDFFIRDEKLFFCIGDVSGKGVPASMFMAVARSLFRNVASHIPSPNIIAKALNESMSEGNDMNMFVTMFVGVFDLPTGVLTYCNAGHDSPLLIGQSVEVLPCDPNLPIGVYSDWDFTVQQVTIAPETTLFLYTDGLNEAENIYHQQFGDERLIELAQEQLAAGNVSPEPLIERMMAAVHFFAGEADQSDDLTMLAIQYKKES